ncbi:MAG: ABC transporter permease, partial [Butyrivibrio sp.]|nr:ABC transporter permease [Butyrivibrio sp.]
MQQKLIRFLEKSGIVTWILLVILWSVAAHFTSPDFLPGPLRTLSGLGELIRTGRLAEDLRISLWRILVGWCRAILIAVPVGLLIGRFRIARWLLEPLLNFFRFIPAIGFITLFLMWFGVGEA